MPRHSPCALCSLTTSSQLFSQLSNYVSSFSLIVVFLPSSKKISSNMKFSISMFATYFASSCSLFNFQDPIEKIADFFDLPYFPLSRKVWAFLLPFFKKSMWWAQARVTLPVWLMRLPPPSLPLQVFFGFCPRPLFPKNHALLNPLTLPVIDA